MIEMKPYFLTSPKLVLISLPPWIRRQPMINSVNRLTGSLVGNKMCIDNYKKLH
jgi:hypothetical protein